MINQPETGASSGGSTGECCGRTILHVSCGRVRVRCTYLRIITGVIIMGKVEVGVCVLTIVVKIELLYGLLV